MKYILVLLLIIVMQFVFMSVPEVYAAQSRVGLGTADSYAVLAGTGITNTGATTITGDVGSSATSTETGFNTVSLTGTNHTDPNPNDAATQGAKTDLVTAYNDAAGRLPVTTRATDLAGATLTAGVYDSAATTFSITGGGTLTLNGEGNTDAVFIFKMGTTLITSSSSKVVLTNGAQACNVYWQVGSSATLGTSTNFVGNILALTSITLNTSATVNGRVLARNGAVTMDTNTITRADCAAGTTGAPTATTSTSASTSTSGGISGGAASIYCPPLASTIVAPFVIDWKRVSPTSISLNWGPQSGTDKFKVEYGFEHGKWLYNLSVMGFSTTIDNLPPNQPIWVQIAARNDCMVGSYGVSKLIGETGGSSQMGSSSVGGPRLPNTGVGSEDNNIPWYILVASLAGISVFLSLIQRKYRFLSTH